MHTSDLSARSATSAELEAMREWEEDREHICKTCGAFPHVESDGDHRWGCVHCNMVTHNPDANFRKRIIASNPV